MFGDSEEEGDNSDDGIDYEEYGDSGKLKLIEGWGLGLGGRGGGGETAMHLKSIIRFNKDVN